MVKATSGTVYECEYHLPNEPCDINHPRQPFRSVDSEKALKHEKEHQERIAFHAKQQHLRETTEEVLQREIRIGQWENWKEIFELGKKLNFIVERQPGMYGQSLSTFSAGIGLVHHIEELIWFQTNEGKLDEHNCRWMKEAHEALQANFVFGPRIDQDKEAKKGRDHLPELWVITKQIARAVKKLQRKFKNIEGMDEVKEYIRYTLDDIERDVKTLAESEGVTITLPSRIP
jgi:ribosome biogenesis protein Nip4